MRTNGNDHGRIVSLPEDGKYLDTAQLSRLEQSFRQWRAAASRADLRFSRQRLLLIFLLIRYTGAKLNEVLLLDPHQDIEWDRQVIRFQGREADAEFAAREVQISVTLAGDLCDALNDPAFQKAGSNALRLDPGFVRRKFYERAESCGFPKRMGGPEMIRQARAVELMQSNVPLPAVQMMLGHSTPNLTSSYVSFSQDEIYKVARLFMEKEAHRKTSARNSFFGKIREIERGDIQSRVTLTTIDGCTITTVITNDSVERLGLTRGRLITAEVKAPWVILQGGAAAAACSADNKLRGTIVKVTVGLVTTECIVRIFAGLEVCAIVSTVASRSLELREGEDVWVLFNSFSVVLRAD